MKQENNLPKETASPDATQKHLWDRLQALGKGARMAIGAAVLALVVLIALTAVFSPTGETLVAVKSSLREMLESSQLSTSQYTYNSIAKVLIDPSKGDTEDNVKYQAAYRGTVTSGFDFEDIEILSTETGITVVIPPIQIHGVEVQTDMDYIFSDAKYDTESTYQEVYNACCQDLEAKAKTNQTLFQVAIDSAVETVTAITKPFEARLAEGQSIRIVYAEQPASEVSQ